MNFCNIYIYICLKCDIFSFGNSLAATQSIQITHFSNESPSFFSISCNKVIKMIYEQINIKHRFNDSYICLCLNYCYHIIYRLKNILMLSSILILQLLEPLKQWEVFMWYLSLASKLYFLLCLVSVTFGTLVNILLQRKLFTEPQTGKWPFA